MGRQVVCRLHVPAAEDCATMHLLDGGIAFIDNSPSNGKRHFLHIPEPLIGGENAALIKHSIPKIVKPTCPKAQEDQKESRGKPVIRQAFNNANQKLVSSQKRQTCNNRDNIPEGILQPVSARSPESIHTRIRFGGDRNDVDSLEQDPRNSDRYREQEWLVVQALSALLDRRRISHLTLAAAAKKPRSGFGVRARRAALPAIAMHNQIDVHVTMANAIAMKAVHISA